MTNPNDSAFPTADVYHPNGQIEYGSPGLTKREWFAAMAMQGMLASPELATLGAADKIQEAVMRADDLIAELNRPAV